MIGLRSEIWKEGEYSYPAAYGFTPIIVSYVHEDEDIRPCMLIVREGVTVMYLPRRGIRLHGLFMPPDTTYLFWHTR